MEVEKFIDVKQLVASKNPKLAKYLPGFVLRYLKRILHEEKINQFLREQKGIQNQKFCENVMKFINMQVKVEGMENIPKDGNCIVAMNHPLGGMDAVALVAALQNYRTDLKFIVNDLLMNLENMSDLFVGVNKHGKNQISTRSKIFNAFASDEMICIFPAGMVSRRKKGKVRDLEWKKTFVSYAKRNSSPIIPIFIDGELSNFFYNLANFRERIGIKANIEMLYLVNELFKQNNKTITFKVGSTIHVSDFADANLSDKEITQKVREKVYKLR